ALRAICDLIGASLRSEDLLFRLGGEEFCLLANVSDAEHAGALAEKVRQVVESHTFPEVGRVTVSIGVANFMEGDTQDSIYARADAALYEAKHQGRNCVR
ncbi:MAG: GGDEF domain-containing protein, partial [Gallionellaceae bacterium]